MREVRTNAQFWGKYIQRLLPIHILPLVVAKFFKNDKAMVTIGLH